MLPHLAIRASAGTGKTHQLASRYIRLLAAGVDPARIVGLTFTRMAAGEIFSKILTRLADAAVQADQAAKLAEDVQLPPADWPPERFRGLLARLVQALPQLALGTIDSFLHRMVHCFVLDLGLAAGFSILDPFAEQEARSEVLRGVFGHGGMDDEARSDLLQAVKEASFGQSRKSILRDVVAYIERHRPMFQRASDPDMWGAAELIWPDGPSWPPATRAQALDAWRQLGERLAIGSAGKSQQGDWEKIGEAIANWQPLPGQKKLSTAVTRLLETCHAKRVPALSLGRGKDREYVLADAEARLAALIPGFFLQAVIERRLRATRGIGRLLAMYEDRHGALIRSRGALSFADLAWILARARLSRLPSPADPGGEEAAARRLCLDFRIDQEIDHWLLDEFQDTSREQWGALANLADEVLQDSSGTRSYFLVGDGKQAIYRWRNGDARLFDELLARYSGVLHADTLDVSWRSSPVVIDWVNRLFADSPELRAAAGATAAARWAAGWRPHRARWTDRSGCVALFVATDTAPGGTAAVPSADMRERVPPARAGVGSVEIDGGTTAVSSADTAAIVYRILDTIRPWTRGLSCAVLTRGNEQAETLIDALRAASGDTMPVAGELDVAIDADNPPGLLLRAVLQALAHPGDSMAAGLIAASPLAAWWGAPGRALALRNRLHGEGFEAVTAMLMDAALATVDDAFSRRRAGQLRAAARQYDLLGDPSIDRFLRFLAAYRERERTADGVVQVMTVHKAKGLDFDMVILPSLHARRGLLRWDGGMLAAEEPEQPGVVRWVLDCPTSEFTAADPVLGAEVEREKAEAAYEALCVLYVAMTRARHGLYMIVNAPAAGKAATCRDAGDLVRLRALADAPAAQPLPGLDLSPAASWGRMDWFVDAPSAVGADAILLRPGASAFAKATADMTAGQAAGVPPDGQIIHAWPPLVAPTLPPARRLPSQAKAHALPPAGTLFAAGRWRAAELGTGAHELMECVEWLTPETTELLQAKAAGMPEELAVAALRLVQDCLAQPAVVAALRPRAGVEVWRETAFDLVLDGDWISGVFDRVEIERDTAGRPSAARIIDFKTDWLPEIVAEADAMLRARYHAQLDLYRQALAQILALDPGAITCHLLAMRAGRWLGV
jgi:superfamily I DNA/RNA helicase